MISKVMGCMVWDNYNPGQFGAPSGSGPLMPVIHIITYDIRLPGLFLGKYAGKIRVQ
ncbi:MAG: hypothetical protein M0Q91_10690 [Methanoregula sp.]|jgi:hypothetical protein|nr:hypothetical protein [Methanoregula sp.]